MYPSPAMRIPRCKRSTAAANWSPEHTAGAISEGGWDQTAQRVPICGREFDEKVGRVLERPPAALCRTQLRNQVRLNRRAPGRD
jgi:hypothetical protein